MRHILLLLSVFLFIGCTKTDLCETGKAAAGLLAAQISVQLECKNVDAVKADVEKKLIELKVCEAPPAPAPVVEPAGLVKPLSAVGDVVCTSVITGLTSGLLTQIPSAWGCTGGKLTDEIKAKLLEACSKAL